MTKLKAKVPSYLTERLEKVFSEDDTHIDSNGNRWRLKEYRDGSILKYEGTEEGFNQYIDGEFHASEMGFDWRLAEDDGIIVKLGDRLHGGEFHVKYDGCLWEVPEDHPSRK